MSLSKVVKSFCGKSEYQTEYGTGTRSFISWDSLKPYLEQAIALKDDEILEGLVIEPHGCNVVIGHKEQVDKK